MIGTGFKLRDDRPVELVRDYRFTGTRAAATADFGVTLSVAWKLGSESLSRSVSINDTPLSELDARIAYSQLDARGPDIDHVVAQVLQHLLAVIAEHSAR